MSDRNAVEIEVLMLRFDRTGLAYRVLTAPLADGENPDDLALTCALLTATPAAVCHSTSWRHVPPGSIVLTYAALPDPEPWLPAVPLLAPAVLASSDARRPGPPDLHRHHVAAHAVRHLGELAMSDPAIRAAAAHDHPLWHVIRSVAAQMRTGTHAELLGGDHSRSHVAPTAAACDDEKACERNGVRSRSS